MNEHKLFVLACAGVVAGAVALWFACGAMLALSGWR